MSPEQVLQLLYDSKINFAIRTVWDGGFEWRHGDYLNGFRAAGRADKLEDAVAQLAPAAMLHFPDSAFAKGEAGRTARVKLAGYALMAARSGVERRRQEAPPVNEKERGQLDRPGSTVPDVGEQYWRPRPQAYKEDFLPTAEMLTRHLSWC